MPHLKPVGHQSWKGPDGEKLSGMNKLGHMDGCQDIDINLDRSVTLRSYYPLHAQSSYK